LAGWFISDPVRHPAAPHHGQLHGTEDELRDQADDEHADEHLDHHQHPGQVGHGSDVSR
jgi:hypothetical protein